MEEYLEELTPGQMLARMLNLYRANKALVDSGEQINPAKAQEYSSLCARTGIHINQDTGAFEKLPMESFLSVLFAFGANIPDERELIRIQEANFGLSKTIKPEHVKPVVQQKLVQKRKRPWLSRLFKGHPK
ncbi:MAG: hypothetical protein V1494_02085 [Candidatus Diapherotrites archaeon]